MTRQLEAEGDEDEKFSEAVAVLPQIMKVDGVDYSVTTMGNAVPIVQTSSGQLGALLLLLIGGAIVVMVLYGRFNEDKGGLKDTQAAAMVKEEEAASLLSSGDVDDEIL